jgi:hypothetical protein
MSSEETTPQQVQEIFDRLEQNVDDGGESLGILPIFLRTSEASVVGLYPETTGPNEDPDIQPLKQKNIQ